MVQVLIEVDPGHVAAGFSPAGATVVRCAGLARRNKVGVHYRQVASLDEVPESRVVDKVLRCYCQLVSVVVVGPRGRCHQPQHRPDRIILIVEIGEGDVREITIAYSGNDVLDGGIAGRRSIVERIVIVHRQVACGTRDSNIREVARAPEGVAQGVRCREQGADRLAGADHAIAIAAGTVAGGQAQGVGVEKSVAVSRFLRF